MNETLLTDPAVRQMGSKAKSLNRLIVAGMAEVVPRGYVVDPSKRLDIGELPLFTSPAIAGTFAVRSCAVGEDTPGRSMAGQFESLLDVSFLNLPNAIDQVAKSAQRVSPAPKMFVLVQEMVKTEISGVCFTSDPEAPEKNRMVVNWSLNANAVTSGAEAQEFLYYPTSQMIRAARGYYPIRVNPVLGYFNRIHAAFGPSDIEWAVNDLGEVRIFQVRSLVSSLRGYAVGRVNTIAPVLVSQLGTELEKNLESVTGDPVALVLPQTWPEDSPVIDRYKDRVAVLVCDHGSRTSHPMILARELKIPAIVGVQWGTKVLENAQSIKVYAADGQGEIFFL